MVFFATQGIFDIKISVMEEVFFHGSVVSYLSTLPQHAVCIVGQTGFLYFWISLEKLIVSFWNLPPDI